MKLNRLIAVSIVGFSLLTTSTSAFACEHDSHSWSFFGICSHAFSHHDHDCDHNGNGGGGNNNGGHDCERGKGRGDGNCPVTGGGSNTGGHSTGGGTTTPPVGPKG